MMNADITPIKLIASNMEKLVGLMGSAGLRPIMGYEENQRQSPKIAQASTAQRCLNECTVFDLLPRVPFKYKVCDIKSFRPWNV